MKDKKKKKLTLSVSGPIKKPQQKIELAKVQNRSSIIIEKKGGRFTKSQTNQPFSRTFNKKKSSNSPQVIPGSSNRDIYKKKRIQTYSIKSINR